MRVPLLALAHARSGDKGDRCNVGVIARRPEWYAVLERELTADRVARHMAPLMRGPVDRYPIPNLQAINFVLHAALDGGGTVSLRTDAQGKVYSTALLRMVLEVPADEARRLGLPADPTHP